MPRPLLACILVADWFWNSVIAAPFLPMMLPAAAPLMRNRTTALLGPVSIILTTEERRGGRGVSVPRWHATMGPIKTQPAAPFSSFRRGELRSGGHNAGHG